MLEAQIKGRNAPTTQQKRLEAARKKWTNQAARRQQSEAIQQARQEPEVEARYAQALSRPEVRAKKSASLKMKMNSPETRAKLATIRQSPEYRQRLIERTLQGVAQAALKPRVDSSQFRGVRRRKNGNNWETRIRIGQRQQRTLGYCPTEIGAAALYNWGVDTYKAGVGWKNRVTVRRQQACSVETDHRHGPGRRRADTFDCAGAENGRSDAAV